MGVFPVRNDFSFARLSTEKPTFYEVYSKRKDIPIPSCSIQDIIPVLFFKEPRGLAIASPRAVDCKLRCPRRIRNRHPKTKSWWSVISHNSSHFLFKEKLAS